MDKGLVLVFNLPAFFATVFIFFSFWVFFYTFSHKVEKILIRNFGDNLKNLYWHKKGNRFFRVLFRVSLFAIFINLFIYVPLFLLLNAKYKNHIEYDDIKLVTYCFLIIIAWIFFINISSYTVIYIYRKQKHANVEVCKDKFSDLYHLISFRINSQNKSYILMNKQINLKCKICKKKIESDKKNQIIKGSLMLIEMYAIIIDKSLNDNSLNPNELMVNNNTNEVISRKDLIIRVNSLFNDALPITNLDN